MSGNETTTTLWFLFVDSVSPAKSFSTSGDGKNTFLFEKGSVLKGRYVVSFFVV